uniref:Uncharacterized protein n=1 Tax=Strigamia maritima TaxID=126957 RepID=T1J8J9_STRMM
MQKGDFSNSQTSVNQALENVLDELAFGWTDNDDPQPATVTSAAHYPMSAYERIHQCNNNNNVASTSYLPPLTRIPETANRKMTTSDISNENEVHLPPMPTLNPFIKQEPDELK